MPREGTDSHYEILSTYLQDRRAENGPSILCSAIFENLNVRAYMTSAKHSDDLHSMPNPHACVFVDWVRNYAILKLWLKAFQRLLLVQP